jgi:Cu(I)/Ag(I) efflux system membrane fusion protein
VSENATVNPFYRRKWFLPGVIVIALMVGYLLGGGGSQRSETEIRQESGEQAIRFWTCSMHPQIRQPGPGLCPICAMDLIPVYEGHADEAGPRTLTLSETARHLADIRTARAERKSVDLELRLAGKVVVDETRIGYITARMPGRIDRLWVDYTGVRVRKGDPMVNLYSPELLSAQEELLQAARSRDASTLQVVRKKLRLWGLTEDQMNEILAQAEPSEHITLESPLSGTVLHRHATVGMYVKTGTQIYTIADLSHVWVTLDAYESDLSWIREGSGVTFEAEAFPGEAFKGTVVFLDPVVDPGTRTIRVRVEVPNPEGRLKPEMFVRAILRVRAPEVDGPPLVIPATAPLITGERALVYIAAAGVEGEFEGREVTLGPRAGDYYIVEDGLSEGERVVVNGAFKIDSALQILAKSSMMSPDGGAPMTGHHHHERGTAPGAGHEEHLPYDAPAEFRTQLGRVLTAYFGIQQGLSQDSLAPAVSGAGSLLDTLGEVDMSLVTGRAHDDWMRELGRSRKTAEVIAGASGIDEARRAFGMLSESMIRTANLFHPITGESIYVIECTMAFNNRGARWLQNRPGVENPYFGSAMFRCGQEIGVLSGHAHE